MCLPHPYSSEGNMEARCEIQLIRERDSLSRPEARQGGDIPASPWPEACTLPPQEPEGPRSPPGHLDRQELGLLATGAEEEEG